MQAISMCFEVLHVSPFVESSVSVLSVASHELRQIFGVLGYDDETQQQSGTSFIAIDKRG
jgi:hypothetical protein